MKTIGLIGGMSWESTLHYYRLINQGVRERLGGIHSAPINMVSVEFQHISEMQHQGRWDEVGQELAKAARTLEISGVDGILICTNTMHKVYDMVSDSVSVPVLHIADATGSVIRDRDIQSVILLGTRFTMEKPFYRERLKREFGLNVIVPEQPDRESIHSVIFDELVQGKIVDSSRDHFLTIIESLIERGGEGVIAGCTEIGLLVKQDQVTVPYFDTLELHANAAVDFLLEVR